MSQIRSEISFFERKIIKLSLKHLALYLDNFGIKSSSFII
ncbi:hypothetical protein TcasGA2_TC032618 [Tribolium castaneum]|uniref:Uncharacterized protein n=1 Tax=Tribolium castaneum TaxID=7070 RepID=A0A139WKI2_TRICA|nr:hypothetical protein TcasGA2_TC032618 [Tribolium castaneum]